MTWTVKVENPELPNWPGASKCYSRAYRILEAMQLRTCKGKKRGQADWPSFDAKRLIEALNKGDEEEIKGLLLMTHVYYV
jgi:hypothetical protein